MKKSEINLKTPERLVIFKAMRRVKTFTVAGISKTCKVRMESVRSLVWLLVKTGYVGAVREGIYRLAVDIDRYVDIDSLPDIVNDSCPPHGQQRMWSAMRVLKRFTALDLAFPAEVDARTAKTYCAILCKAQYLLPRGKDETGQRGVLYQFNPRKDTGFHAPQVRRARTGKRMVYDRNLGQIVWPESEAA